jgi:apolipoprotein N-acyltransferase
LLEIKFDWEKSKKPVLILASVIVMIFIFGAIKTSSLMAPGEDTIKVAAIIIHPEWGKTTPMEKVFADKMTSPFEKRLSEIESLTKTVASNGAKIASFMEFAMIINEEDHDKLREEFRRISKENDIYLVMSYAYFAKEGKGENKHLLIDNNGEILLDYTKRYLAGIGDIGETGVFIKGPEIIQSVETPYGKITVTVCRDMEMAKYMKQAGEADVDIMFSSAYEWPKAWIPNNPHRAIENGFSLVRTTYNGVSHSQDYNGKILNQMYFEETDSGIMYTDVPTKGVKTLYPRVGKSIGWLSALGLLVLIGFAIKHRKKEN